MKTGRTWLMRMLSPALLIILLFFLFLPRPAVREIETAQEVEVVYQGEALELTQAEREQLLTVLSTARCRPTHLERRHPVQPIQISVTTAAASPMRRVTLELGDRPRCTYPLARWTAYRVDRPDQLRAAVEPICQAARNRTASERGG